MATVELDTRDLQILALIDRRLTHEEMAEELGLAAKSGIFRRVERMLHLGFITKDPRKSRSRRLTDNGRQVLDGFVATFSEAASE
jgi:DNA-binding IclR family transcriptional regulator